MQGLGDEDVQAIEDDKDWVPVAWITLTQPNHTPIKYLLEDARRFVDGLSKFTKCELNGVWGVMYPPNTHGHIIPRVPPNEVERFLRRVEKFQPQKQWSYERHWHMEPFKPGLGTFYYVLQKHFPRPTLQVCPQYYSRCRKGLCEHIGRLNT